MTEKDLVIIGGGAAGMSSGIFASRLGLNTVILEQLMPGGQVINSEHIEDYPGFPEGISGAELTAKMQDQAMSNGVDIELSEVTDITDENDRWIVQTTAGAKSTKAIIIAGGSSLRKLQVKGEDELVGAGVSYCATCDGAFFIDQNVCVIGGGDSALEEALTLTNFAGSVEIFCRGETLHGQKVLVDRANANDKINIHTNVEITEIHGNEMVDGASLRNLVSGETTRIDTDGVFIFVGLEPNSDYLSPLMELDGGGHIKTDSRMRTSKAGILAAGDIRSQSASQLIAAAGDGATAAITAFEYVKSGIWSTR
ncbi:MAG: FAD-binding protein [SAR202 cluster bacterium]|jgi:thioredoxin reductase (NADPH)|nr:MAG: FAD-binding protein [SAR202 cluster bacterium]MQG74799.1 FAD-binding protein [SAR202 cluster bacterium]|tara:strand:+ start:9327 stop:10259 length:933 start_codon:yes stop_codon:yes gene_type:complete